MPALTSEQFEAPLPRNRILRARGINLRPAWEIIDCSREAVAAAPKASVSSSSSTSSRGET